VFSASALFNNPAGLLLSVQTTAGRLNPFLVCRTVVPVASGGIMAEKQTQHFVAQMYLRGFLDPELLAKGQHRLWVYAAGTTPEARGTKRVAAETLFYQTPELEGREDFIEEELSKLESWASGPLRKLRVGEINLTNQERSDFASFIGLCLARVPFFRDVSNSLRIEATRQGMEEMSNDPEVLRRVIESIEKEEGAPLGADMATLLPMMRAIGAGEVEVTQTSKAWMIKEMLELSLHYTEVFEHMRWNLVEAPAGRSFITSDCPVHVIDSEAAANGPHKFALTDRAIFTFPISDKYLLLGDKREGPDRILGATSEQLAGSQNDQIGRAYRQVYASFESSALQKAIDRVHSVRPPRIPQVPSDFFKGRMPKD
jgi:hypothetical protein